MSFWKKLFGVKESPEADVAKSKSAEPSTTFARRDSEANLERWKSSEEPEAWVRVHMKAWNHQDWLELLASLRGSKFWPMDEAAIGQHIEMLRAKLVGGLPCSGDLAESSRTASKRS